jgi:hypothetical protein
MDKYWTDKDFRMAINEQNKARSLVKVCCADCKTNMNRSSMLPHKKICKGFRELTPLELLTNCLVELKL